jgi:beta-alanine degradation protein BauB
MTEERELGPVATEVVFENDRVRIWEMRLAPGERSAIHKHDLDYMLVLLEGDRIAADPEPDTGGAFNQYFEADVVPGSVVYIERGGIETAVNIGKQPYREILIELKD